MKNEECTSKRVSAIAGKIMRKLKEIEHLKSDSITISDGPVDVKLCTAVELAALAGSCLTQTADKKK